MRLQLTETKNQLELVSKRQNLLENRHAEVVVELKIERGYVKEF